MRYTLHKNQNNTKELRASEKRSRDFGFSLVEMLVAMSVFVFIIMIASTINISMGKGQRKAFVLQNIQESGRFLLESMVREIRTSVVDFISFDGRTLTITNDRGESINYFFDTLNGRIMREGQRISSDDVFIEGGFYVRTYTDPDRSVVTIVMKVSTVGGRTEEQAEMYLESTAATRK